MGTLMASTGVQEASLSLRCTGGRSTYRCRHAGSSWRAEGPLMVPQGASMLHGRHHGPKDMREMEAAIADASSMSPRALTRKTAPPR